MRRNKYLLLPLFFCAFTLLQCSKSSTNEKKPNILLICVDDLRPELNCFGKEYIHSPNIDQLAENGFSFHRHFVNAPSCGPSRYTLLTGKYGPPGNNALFLRAQQISEGLQKVDPSMPEWFRKHGYTTVSVGKVSHHPGGRGGSDWNDSTNIEMPGAWDKHLIPVAEWQHPRGVMHGLAHGEIRVGAGDMDVFQAAVGGDDIYPDGAIAKEAQQQLKVLSEDKDKPFFLAVGFIRPHLPFGAPKSYFDLYEGVELPEIEHPQKPDGKTTWHPSNEFMKYNRWGKDPNQDAAFAEAVRRHYAACVSYADAQVGKVLSTLERTGAAENTIVILWGDHGWHLGEHAIWGKHSLFEESLHSPLILHYPKMKTKNQSTNAIVETLDVFPTLCDIAGIEMPPFVQGTSLRGIIENPNANGHTAIGYTNRVATIRTATHRLMVHEDGFAELYDHTTVENETKNVADQKPGLVKELQKMLEARLK